MAKDFVVVKGKLVKMNEAAFKIAAKHFGAAKGRTIAPGRKNIPNELLSLPKLPIIPAVKTVKKVDEIPVDEPIEAVVEETVETVAEEKPVAVKKTVQRKRTKK